MVWRPDQSGTVPPVYVLMGPRPRQGLPLGRPALEDDKGTKVIIVECPPGDTPVLLPVSTGAEETFMCLKGRVRGRWGEHGEHATVLEPFDMMAVPADVCRDFVNLTNETAFLLAMLSDEVETKAPTPSRESSVRRRPRARLRLATARRVLSGIGLPVAGMLLGLSIPSLILWWVPWIQSHDPSIRSEASSTPRPYEAQDGAKARSRPEMTAPAGSADGPELAPLREFGLIARPSGVPLVAASVILPAINGREGVVRASDLWIAVQRSPRSADRGRVVEYTVRISESGGRPVIGADVRLRAQTADGSTVETSIDPSGTSGVYQSAVLTPAAGLREVILRVVPPETLWDSIQRVLGPGPSVVHLVRLPA